MQEIKTCGELRNTLCKVLQLAINGKISYKDAQSIFDAICAAALRPSDYVVNEEVGASVESFSSPSDYVVNEEVGASVESFSSPSDYVVTTTSVSVHHKFDRALSQENTVSVRMMVDGNVEILGNHGRAVVVRKECWPAIKSAVEMMLYTVMPASASKQRAE